MLRLWKQLIKMNIKRWMEYRLDFFIGIFAIFITNALSIVFFWVIFQHIPVLNGWRFEQILFLVGLSYLTIAMWHVFLSGPSPHRIERHIRNGEFDRILLKPINPLLLLIISRIDDDGFGDIIAGILILSYASSTLSITWTLQNIAFIILTMFGGVLIIFSVILLLSTATFWIVRSGMLSQIFWPLIKFVELPLDIYNPFVIFFLTFILPFGFVNYYPAQVFLGKGLLTYVSYLTPLVGIILFFIAYSAWKYGIKNYTSTGS
jgi:ABC-2 type transport system permease protein